MELALPPLSPGDPQAPDAVEAAERRAPARLLEYRPGALVAFPAHTTVGLVDNPPVVAVPGAPAHALGLVAWEGRQLPLLDLARLLGGDGEAQPSAGHVLVLAWQAAPGAPVQHGAVCAASLVRMTPGLVVPFLFFTGLYVLLAIAVVWLMRRQILASPDIEERPAVVTPLPQGA